MEGGETSVGVGVEVRLEFFGFFWFDGEDMEGGWMVSLLLWDWG